MQPGRTRDSRIGPRFDLWSDRVAFRAQLRTSREKATPEVTNSRSSMKTTVSAFGSIRHVDSLCVEN
jgi:hypothetical protein